MSGPAMIQDLPVAEVDMLGVEDGVDWVLGNAALAERLSLAGPDETKKAATAIEDEQLLELAAPAGDLLKVAGKLAMAVRLAGWALDTTGSYAAPLTALLGSALSGVIVLRQAELRRRELVEQAEAGRRREVLTEAREARTEVVETVRDLAARIAALEADGRPEPVAT
jgi:hypothetical protein